MIYCVLKLFNLNFYMNISVCPAFIHKFVQNVANGLCYSSRIQERSKKHLVCINERKKSCTKDLT